MTWSQSSIPGSFHASSLARSTYEDHDDMRLSEFRLAVSDEFGEAYGRVLTQDLALAELGGRTAAQAILDGRDAREIWLALCRATDVPDERWYGVGQREPRKTNDG